MRRHLIIEGCDASGKDTLIKNMFERQVIKDKFIVHERASTSLGGPVASLENWVTQDLINIYGNDRKVNPISWIYNRHPLISELIYAEFREVNRGLSGMFKDSAWVGTQRRVLATNVILVICQPPWPIINKQMIEQGPNAHMPGVYENRHAIYNGYRNLSWPGMTIRYDRTRSSVDDLIRNLGWHLEA